MGIIERISEAEAIRDPAVLIERARKQGVCFEIVRDDVVVARLEPVASSENPKVKTMAGLVEALRRLPPLSEEESVRWEQDLAEIRKSMPVQRREWD